VPTADMLLLTPGLSVIIDAIKESRESFQRMNNYAIYRTAAYRAFDAACWQCESQ
jgi:magnesium-transporting ATPase (P-type)